MLGTPARLLIAIRTALVTGPGLAYSRRYRAASTPKGTANSVMMSVMAMVPQIAGKYPPALLDCSGSSSRNSRQREK